METVTLRYVEHLVETLYLGVSKQKLIYFFVFVQATQQLSPQSTSPRSQRTPVASDAVPHPRSSTQTTPVHAIADISALASQDEMMVQHNSVCLNLPIFC